MGLRLRNRVGKDVMKESILPGLTPGSDSFC